MSKTLKDYIAGAKKALRKPSSRRLAERRVKELVDAGLKLPPKLAKSYQERLAKEQASKPPAAPVLPELTLAQQEAEERLRRQQVLEKMR